ncbi:hypothetical protein DYB32_007294, partial [Aphanomyces invadans]
AGLAAEVSAQGFDNFGLADNGKTSLPHPFKVDPAVGAVVIGLDRYTIVVSNVGDRLSTDIEFGRRGGLHTLLVMSGCTTYEEKAAIADEHQRPDYYVEDVDVLNALAKRIAEQHKMAEEEAAKKRQMELEMEERRRAVLEQAAKEQHDDVVRQADADERRMRQKAAQQERRIAGTMKAPAKAAVPEEAAAFVQRTADDRKAAKQREMPHDVDTSLEPARPATPAPSVSKPARATKPSGAKKRKQQKSSKDDLDDGGGAPINAPSAAKKQRVATESDPDKRATESDPVKRATATTKSASVDAAMEDEHASDSVGFSEAKAIQPQKPRKGKKKNMMKELAAQEKQRRKEAARKEKLEKYALAVKKKQDELAAKRAKAAAKPVVQSRPTHGDDTSVIAKPKAKSSKTAQPAAEKQQSAPQPIALGEGASSDDEPSGLSLFDRMAQKMRQQILAKEGGAAKAPAPPKHVPAKPTPSPNDAPPKRSILSSIFSVPLLKKP